MFLNSVQQTTTSTTVLCQNEVKPPRLVIQDVSYITGPLDVYCWYEGVEGLPESGAHFMSDEILKPLFAAKKDTKVFLYSLKAWSFKNRVSEMNCNNPLADVVNRIDNTRLELIDSASFFQYCAKPLEKSALHEFLIEELPKKKGLMALSAQLKNSGKSIKDLFGEDISLFTPLDNWDLGLAYGFMHYVEGYYLLRESVERGLKEGRNPINVAFVLPNDEYKYYVDFLRDLEKMLELDFGYRLKKTVVVVSFNNFSFGSSLKSRPYIDSINPNRVEACEIAPYFNFLKG